MHADGGAFFHQAVHLYLEERKITLPLLQKNLVQYSHIGVSPSSEGCYEVPLLVSGRSPSLLWFWLR